MKKVSITVCVLTRNEEDNIEHCLRSLLWSEEIILLDDSTDQTAALAKKTVPRNKLRVISVEACENFSALRNKGLKKAKHDWVLFIDADEEVSRGLANEIEIAIRDEHVNGYFVRRCDYFLGKWLKHGETGDIKMLKLGRKSAGTWKRRVHEVWEVKGQIGVLDNPLLHYPHPTIGEFLERINRWTTLDAEEFYKSGVRVNGWKVAAYPMGKFLRNYFIKFGFLDGMPGLILVLMMSFHSFLTRGKLFMLHKS